MAGRTASRTARAGAASPGPTSGRAERRGAQALVHPLGKIERFRGTLWREFLETAVFADLGEARARIGHFIDYFNFQRSHSGIEGLVPADRFFSAATDVARTLKERVAANALDLARLGLSESYFHELRGDWLRRAVELLEPQPVDGCLPNLIAVRDLASHYQLAWQATATQTADEACAELERLFLDYGAPLVLKADNGSAFISAEFQALLARQRVVILYSPARHPQYNGALERSNGTLTTYTQLDAARDGHPLRWTSDNVSLPIPDPTGISGAIADYHAMLYARDALTKAIQDLRDNVLRDRLEKCPKNKNPDLLKQKEAALRKLIDAYNSLTKSLLDLQAQKGYQTGIFHDPANPNDYIDSKEVFDYLDKYSKPAASRRKR